MLIIVLGVIAISSRPLEQKTSTVSFTDRPIDLAILQNSLPVNLIEESNQYKANLFEATVGFNKILSKDNNTVSLLDVTAENKPALNFSLVTGSNLNVSSENNKLNFVETNNSYRIEYSTFEKYVKEEIVLLNASSPKEFSFKINSDENIKIEKDSNGGLNVTLNQSPVYYIHPIITKDSNGNIIDYSYKVEGNTIGLIPLNYSQFINAKYPIVIDPTISWLFTNSTNYILSDPTKIEISNNTVRLKNNNGTYATDNPYVISNNPIIYTTLSGFSETLGANNQGGVKYQLSNNNVNWFNSSWNYRQRLNIAGAASNQTDFQVRVNLNTSTLVSQGKLQSGCQDIRLTDSAGNVLNHWIETGTNACNTSSTNIWVKIPSIPTSGTFIYVYYGNSSATDIQNPNNVFLFFDGFTGSSIDNTKWTLSAGASTSVSNGELFIATGSVYTPAAILPSNRNVVFDMRSKVASTAAGYTGITISDTSSLAGSNANSNKVAVLTSNTNVNISQMAFAASGIGASYDIAFNTFQFTPTANTYFISGFGFDSTTLKYHQNRATTSSYSTTVEYAPFLFLGYPWGSGSGASNGTDITIDFVLARKTDSTEPSAVAQPEETKLDNTWYWWNGSSWVLTNSGFNESNTASEVNSNISAFSSQFGPGRLVFKAFLNAANSSQQVELAQVTIDYTSSTAPTISSLSINSGSTVGDYDVTITGTNFVSGLETKTYNFTGSDQTYTVPAGVTSIRVKMWGGGGGGGHRGGWTFGYDGGGGGYTTADIAVTPGQVLTVMVGAGGGAGNTANTTANYGGGGPSCIAADCQYGGQGGGRSAIRLAGEDILTAGGGGGGGSTVTLYLNQFGGGGGGLSGQDGRADGNTASSGKGGTQGSGGTGGTGNQNGGSAGSKYLGGRANTQSYGGSGGGGWFGGGGGAYQSISGGSIMGGGGGGSSYIGGVGVSNAVTVSGNYATPGNNGDLDSGNAGAGGAPSTVGRSGKVVIDILPRSVTFGGVTARNVRFINSNTIVATVPANVAGSVDVKVTNPDGQSTTLANGFTYTAPTITLLEQTSGTTMGGTDVTIKGNGFVRGVETKVYEYTGSDQTYVVPAGVNSIKVKVWGGGGGGGHRGGWTFGYQGGGGGYATADVAVTPGQTLVLMVGAGGGRGSVSNPNYIYGGGAPSCIASDCQYGGQGGGRSAIRLNSEDILTAGGGGGGASTVGMITDQSGGGGGGLVGEDGKSTANSATSGKGGTQVGGGAGGTGNQNAGSPGLKYVGGRANTQSYGGSGGGGWFGGGGGGYSSSGGSHMGGGGGGSGYIGGVSVSNGILAGAIGRLSGYYFDVYNNNAGFGGLPSNNGSNGRIVIEPSNPSVTFGGVAATNVRYIDSQTLIVTTPKFTNIGSVDVVVRNPDGQLATLPNSFTYVKPTITGITPNSGSTAGGTDITITGTDFRSSLIENTFVMVNSDQIYVVPEGVNYIQAKMWGAGGGGGSKGGWNFGFAGGGGGYTESIIPVTPGQSLSIMVGMGGSNGSTSLSYNSYGGGGRNCNTGVVGGCQYGGQGGGRSAIRLAGEDVITAGGGGGGGSSRILTIRQHGGAGGGLIGQAGLSDQIVNAIGKGGSQTGGGAGGSILSGVSSTAVGNAGSKYTGGTTFYSYGGTGGGGWFGGGGGAYVEPNTMGGGGGGSSYIGYAGLINPRVLQGNLNIQANSTDFENAGAGAGGAENTIGQNGRVIIRALPVRVSIGGVEATNIRVINSTTITATVPANVVGSADVIVTNPDGQTAILEDGFNYLTSTVDSVTPNTGSSLGGTEITITGSNFYKPNTIIYDYVGSDQTYEVPSGVTSIGVKLWGAGGGGGNLGNWTMGHPSGAGGFTAGNINVMPGQSLAIMVGAGGAGGQYSSPLGYGGGGTDCTGSDCIYGAAGGGRSAIRVSGEDIITAGGGGGGGSTNSNSLDQAGGAGGGLVGENGRSATLFTTFGTGGGSHAGGAGGYGAGATGNPGIKYNGGAPGQSYGGAGGGGWFGGGAGGYANSSMGGGGGGSSYFNGPGVFAGFSLAGIGTTQGNALDPDNGGAGAGATASNTGRSGRVVITTNPIKVEVGGIQATNVRFIDSNTIKAIIPTNSVGTKDIIVTNSDGTVNTLPASFTYTGQTITSITPDVGASNGGTNVTITGSNIASSLNTQVFDYAAKDQNYAVPNGVNNIKVKLWGGGGGGGVPGNWNFGYAGGGGGYTESEMTVTPGQGLSVMVGAGGNRGAVSHLYNQYGGGGANCNGNCVYGGQGGGRSALRLNNEDIVTAGAGGGGGSSRSSTLRQTGGAGGGLIGQTGLSEEVIFAGGRGGSQTAGGAAGIAPGGNNGTAGAKYNGGNTYLSYGGSGGGGWYGGGAGSFKETNTMGGGGGGSSYIGDGSLINPFTSIGNLNTQANSTDIDNGGAGAGGAAGVAGNPGKVIVYSAPTRVAIGGVYLTNVRVVDSNTITGTTIPTTPGIKNVDVTSPSGQISTLTESFTVIATPTITSLAPEKANKNGGTVITITGTNFYGSPTVRFNGVDATSVSLINSSTIQATSPARPIGPADVIVINPDGQQVTLTSGVLYTEPSPLVTSVTPSSGPTNGGTSVTIIGNNFVDKGASAVSNGLLAHWPFNEADGQNVENLVQNGIVPVLGLDSSVDSSDPTRLNLPNCKYGKCLSFDGNDYINIASNFNRSGTLSYSLWFKTTEKGPISLMSQLSHPAGTTPSGGYVPILWINNAGNLNAEIYPLGITASANPVNDGQWHMVTITSNNNTYSFYLDGQLVGSKSGTIGQTWWNHTAIGTAYIDAEYRSGNTFPTNWYPFKGLIDDVRIYNRPLTAQEVATNFNYADNDRDLRVLFGSNSATAVTLVNSTTITANTPAGSGGLTNVTVINPDDQSGTLNNGFRYIFDKFAIVSPPISVKATEPATMVVQAQDINGNPIILDTNVTLNLSSTSPTGFFAIDLNENEATRWDYTSVTIPAGASSATFYYKDNQKGTPTITADTGNAGSLPATQVATIKSKFAFLVTGVTSPIKLGVPSSVTIVSVDYQGSPQNDYEGTIAFSSSDPATILPSNFTFTSSMLGEHTFVNGVTMVTQGEFCITATDINDSDITGSQCGIIVNPPDVGTIARLKILNGAQTIPLDGRTTEITVQAQDTNGTGIPVQSPTSLYFYTDSETGQFSIDGTNWFGRPFTTQIPAYATSRNFFYKDSSLGSHTIVVRDDSVANLDGTGTNAGWENDQVTITTVVGSANKLALTGIPSSLAAGTVSTPISVSMQDVEGNNLTATQDRTVYLSSNSSNLVFSLDGVNNFNTSLSTKIRTGESTVPIYVRSNIAGTVSITVSDANPADGATGLVDDSKPINIVAAAPAKLVFTTAPSEIIAGAASEVFNVQLQDNFNNPSTVQSNYPVYLSTLNSDGVFSATSFGTTITNISIPAGSNSVNFYFKQNKFYASQTIYASDTIGGFGAGGITDAQTVLTVTPGTATQLSILEASPYAITAGVNSGPFTAILRNSFGVEIPAANDLQLYFYTNSIATVKEFSILNSPWNPVSSYNLTAGNSRFSFYYKDTKAATTIIRVSDDDNSTFEFGLTNASLTLTVNAAAASNIKITSSPYTIDAGVASGAITFTLYDQFNNIAKSVGTTTVNLTSNSATGRFDRQSNGAFNGSITTQTIANNLSSANFYYRDTTIGTPLITVSSAGLASDSQTQTIVYGNVTRFDLTVNSTNLIAGVSSQAITLRTYNAGNVNIPVQSDFNVNLTSSRLTGRFDSSSTGLFDGTYTILTVPSGQSSAVFYYRETTAGAATVSASRATFTTATRNFTVTANTASKIVFKNGNPVDLNTGQKSLALYAQTQDQYNNVSNVGTATTIYLHSTSSNYKFFNSLNNEVNSITINTGSSESLFYYQDYVFGTHVLTLSDFVYPDFPDQGLTNESRNINITYGSPSKLRLTKSINDLQVGEAGLITLSLLNAYDQEVPATSSLLINLQSTSGTGKFDTAINGLFNLTSITINNGSSNINFYYKDTIVGVPTITASRSGFTSGTTTINLLAANVFSLMFNSAPKTIIAGNASSSYIIRFRDQYGNFTTTNSEITINLSSTGLSGEFALSSLGPWGINSVVVPAGEIDARFNYRDTVAGVKTLSVSANTLVGDTQNVTVNASSPVSMQFVPNQGQTVAGQLASNPITVVLFDQFSNPAKPSVPITLNLTSTSSNYQFSLNSNPWNPVTNVIVDTNSTQSVFYYKDWIIGTPTITVSDAANILNAIDLEFNIIASEATKLLFESDPKSTIINTPTTPISFYVADINNYKTQFASDSVINVTTSSAGGQFSIDNGDTWSSDLSFNVLASTDTQRSFLYVDSIEGNPIITISSAGLTSATQTQTVILGNISKIQILGDNTITAGTALPITIEALNSLDELVSVSADTIFTLTSTSLTGEFSLSDTNWIAIEEVTLNRWQNQKTIYYKDTLAGSATITVDEKISQGWTAGTKVINTNSAGYFKITFLQKPSSVNVNQVSTQFIIQTVDQFGNLVNVGNRIIYVHPPTSAQLSLDGINDFISTPLEITIPDTEYLASFYYIDSLPGNKTISVSDKQLLDNPDVDIVNATASINVIGEVAAGIRILSNPYTDQNAVIAGEYTGAITIEAYKADNSPAILGTPLTIDLSTIPVSAGEFKIAPDALSNSILFVDIPIGFSSIDVYFRSTLAGTHTLEFNSNGLTGVDQLVEVIAAAPNRFNFVTLPQTVSAGNESELFRVILEDQYGNPSVYQTDLTIGLITNSASGKFSSQNQGNWSDITQLQLTSGNSDIYFYYKDTVSGNYQLSVDEQPSVGIIAGVQEYIVTAGEVAEINFLTLPNTLEANQSSNIISVTLLDVYGNNTFANNDLNLYLYSNTNTGVFSNSNLFNTTINSIVINTGTSNGSFYFKDTIAGSPIVTVSDQPTLDNPDLGIINAVQTQTINWGNVIKFKFINSNSSIAAGDVKLLQLRLLNAYEGIVPATNNITVFLNSTSGLFSLGTSFNPGEEINAYTISTNNNGVDIYFRSTQSGSVNVSASDVSNIPEDPDTGIENAVQTFTVHSAQLQRLVFITTPQNLIVGQSSNIMSVQARDVYGNITSVENPTNLYVYTTSLTGRFSLSTTFNDSSYINQLSLSPGASSVSFYYRDLTFNTPASNPVIRVSNQFPNPVQEDNIIDATQMQTVTAGNISKIVYTPSNSFGTITAGNPIPITAVLQNQYDVEIPLTTNKTFYLFSSLGGAQFATWNGSSCGVFGINSIDLNTNNSRFTYCYKSSISGNSTLTVSDTVNLIPDTAWADAVGNITIETGSITQIAFNVSGPIDIIARHPSQELRIETRNQFGNPTPVASNRTIFLRSSSSSGEFSLSSSTGWGINFATIPAGQNGVSVYYRDSTVTSTPLTITAADSLPLIPDINWTNGTLNINILTQVVDNFLVTNISDPQIQGNSSSVVVMARDSENYIVDWYTGTISFTSSDLNAVLPSSYTFQLSDKGIKTFSNGIAFSQTGEHFVRVTDTNGIQGTQNNITVNPNPAGPITQVRFKDATNPTNIQKDRTSIPLTVQLRDANGQGSNAGVGGYTVRVTSSSATGQFASNPSGPWSNTGIFTILQNFSVTNFYYKDSQAGNYTLTVSDWLGSQDDIGIANDTLPIVVNIVSINVLTDLEVNNNSHIFVDSPIIYAKNDTGDFTAKVSFQISMVDALALTPKLSNLIINWKDPQGNVLLNESINSTSSYLFNVPQFQGSVSSSNYQLEIIASTTDGNYNEALTVNIPVSGWTIKVDYNPNNINLGQPLSFTVETKSNGVLADPDNLSVNFKDNNGTDVGGSGYIRYLSDLNKTSTGRYSGTLQTIGLTVPDPYYLYARVFNSNITLAEDNNNDIFFENNPTVAPKNFRVEKIKTSSPTNPETFNLKFDWDNSIYAIRYNLYRSTNKFNTLFQDTCSISQIKSGNRLGDIGAIEPYCDQVIQQNINTNDTTSWVKMAEINSPLNSYTIDWSTVNNQLTNSTYFFVLRAQNEAGESNYSSMLSLNKYIFTSNSNLANTNWISIPYNTVIQKASDLVTDIEGGIGVNTNGKINTVTLWKPNTQSVESFKYNSVLQKWVGTDFNIAAGDGISVILSGNTSSFSWSLVGGDSEIIKSFNLNSNNTNKNWLSLALTSKYQTASDIVNDIEGNLSSNQKISSVSKWNAITQSRTNYIYNSGNWTGVDFVINPGDSIMITLSGNQSTFNWTPYIVLKPNE